MNVIAMVLTMAVLAFAQEHATVAFPEGFRSWDHVKSIVVGPEHPSFPRRGGMHHYYANEQAMEGYRTGRFPNGSVIVDEAVLTKDGEGQAKGILLEATRRGLDVMVKNDRLYRETGGWGFDHFDGDTKTSRLPASDRMQCYTCHAKRSDRDHVYSSIRP